MNKLESINSKLSGLLLVLLVLSRSLVSVAETPIAPQEAWPEIDWSIAENYVGRFVSVSGHVAKVGHSKKVHFINFDPKRRDAFKVVIFSEFLPNFPDSLENLYNQKIIRVRGQVVRYATGTEIRVTSPDQIEILDELPERITEYQVPKTLSPKQELTVATYNILNLYDAADDVFHNDDTTPAKSRAELEQVARVIREIDADVLALQEVENRGYLQRFVDVFLADMGYQHVVHYEGNDLRGSDVCLLSRVPVGAVTSHRHRTFEDERGCPQQFRRDLLCVEVLPPGGDPFEMWVVHMKSSYDGHEHAKRVRYAEARQIRQLLEQRWQRNPRAAIVLCGDFNAQLDSRAMQHLLGNDTNLQMCGFWQHIPEENRITYNRKPHRSMIDFLLFSPGMVDRYVEDSYRIRLGEYEKTGSDHNPVVARVRAEAK